MGKRREPAQLARDRRRISEMYLHGRLQADIAAELHLSQTTISQDLKGLQAEWRASSLLDINEAKARELARIDDLERTYWQAWARSQEDAETERKRVIEGGRDGRKYEAGTETKGQVGDPRFLQGIQWCIERRCKVIGVDAPKTVAIHGVEDAPPVRFEGGEDQTARVLRGLAAAGVIVPGAAPEHEPTVE